MDWHEKRRGTSLYNLKQGGNIKKCLLQRLEDDESLGSKGPGSEYDTENYVIVLPGHVQKGLHHKTEDQDDIQPKIEETCVQELISQTSKYQGKAFLWFIGIG